MKRLKILLSLLFLYSVSFGQVYINEFMASNTSTILDPDYKQSADWIELYNAGTTAVNLDGYFLTDNLKKPSKWKITKMTIAAKGFALFWADNKDSVNHTSFSLSASGEQVGLSNRSGALIDSVSYGVQPTDLSKYGAGSITVLDSTLLGVPDANISMGRKPDGSSDWMLFTHSTPGITNKTVGYSDIVKSDPGFSRPGGVYHSAVTLTIKSIFGGDVRYTLDGTEPNEQSLLSNEPIIIAKNTVVRARICKPRQIPGLVSTYTYLIDTENKINKLPIVCLSSAPDNFWAADSGIYVMRNFKPLWEVPINVELYENDGRTGAAFNKRAGVKVNGLYSWQLPQKMLGIYFRKEYGSTKLDYPWILDKARTSYKDFAFRASGSDWSNTLFRDGMQQTSTVGYTNFDILGFRACVVYLNGEFLGIHNIREKYDENYIVENHGEKAGTFNMVLETDTEPIGDVGDPNIVEYKHMVDLAAKDLTNQANYDALAADMDVDNFTDLICTEVYSSNGSIDHNVEAWKPKGSGKWKWLLMDLDRGFYDYRSNLIGFYLNNTNSSGRNPWPFKSLMKNANFKKQFGKRLADLLFTCFNSSRMIPRIDAHQKAIEADMPEHIKRWAGTHSSYGDPISSMDYWYSEVEKLRTFAKARPGIILNDIANYGFQAPVPVSVTTYPAKAGVLTFNGLKIPVDVCTGGYPKGETIKLTATAKDGYKFMGWKTTSGSANYISTASELVVSSLSAVNITAEFEGDGRCILPSEIASAMTLHKSCSPYIVPENVNITSTGKLIIEPGVEIWMSDGVSISSLGPVKAIGTKTEPIIIKSNPQSLDKKWGNISIKNANDTVWFKHVIIESASQGPNPVRDIAALAVSNSTVMLDSIYIENVHKNPLNVYNCQTTITNSRLHSDYAGCDEINIKRGKILISNCEFIGNTGVDSDALDFGDMDKGNAIVRNSYFHDMDGFNSDAVDLGDHAKNVIVDSIVVYNFQDKGVSIGQQSSATITNSVFINCGMGAGMKDSSSVRIDHCTYYGNFYALANYQKHPGDAGSNLVVTNTILSNSYELGYFSDEFSALSISNSSDDTELLPAGKNNLNVNPLFTNPAAYDFSLLSGSPLIDAATNGTIGANIKLPVLPVSVMITDIAYVTDLGTEDLEFIGLYNPGNSRIHMDSCMFAKGVTFIFPAGTSIGAKEKLYVTSNAASAFWNGRGAVVYQWESGHLSDGGEKIQLVNKYGKVIDQVIYDIKAPWPVPQNSQEGITLSRFDVDNHFGEYWKILPIGEMVNVTAISNNKSITVYPNPANDRLKISTVDEPNFSVEMYSSLGQLVKQFKLDYNGEATIDVSNLNKGIYMIKIGKYTSKVMVSR